MGKSNKFSLTTKSHSSTRVNPYDKITLNALNVSCPDKQIVLPKLDSNGGQHACIELYSLLIFIIALGTQYLNLYRSVWWLSKTRNNQPINFHLIDFDVSQFSLIFIGQSALISIIRALLNKRQQATTTITQNNINSNSSNTNTNANNSSSSNGKHAPTTIPTTLKLLLTTQSQQNNTTSNNSNSNNQLSTTPTSATNKSAPSTASHNEPPQKQQQLQQTSTTQPPQLQDSQYESNVTTLATVLTACVSWICNYYLLKCAYRIWTNFGFNGVSCISYPIVVSIFMNSTHIIHVVECCRKTGKLNLSFLTLSMTLFSSHIRFDDEKLCHNCSNQPDEIRDEVEKLRTIFNERLKFILFKSILLAYYSSFVPICFAQSFLYYDYTWTAQHVGITWFSSLIMLISSSYTPHFYDVLHRSAYHFGKWQKLETRNTLVPCINWSENVIYPQGVVVKHYRGYFRSESVSNCAQPGVQTHLRYYVVFSNPKIGYAATLVVLGLLLSCQMYLLLASTEWYKLIAMTNMMLINVHSIFRLIKSLVVITKIYKEKH